MAWMDDGLVAQLTDAHERILHADGVAERQIGPTNRSGEQQVAAEHDVAVSEDHVAGGVSGQMRHVERQ